MKKILLTLLLCSIGELLAQQSPNEKTARGWIAENIKNLKFNESNLKLNHYRNTAAGEIYRFQPTVEGIPVFDQEIVVNINSKNEVVYTTLNIDGGLPSINTTPSITKEQSIEISDKELEVSGLVTFQESKLVVYTKLAEPKLVYRTVTSFEEKSGAWECIIDALNGKVLSVKNIAIYCGTECNIEHKHVKTGKADLKSKAFMPIANSNLQTFATGTAYIFEADPLSKMQQTYTGSYVDNNDATNASLDAARTLVNLPEIELNAGTYKLKSTYVEIKNLENPNKGLFTQASANFQFNRNQDGFEAANVFYHTDNQLRYINQTLGVACLQNVNNTHAGILWFDPSGENGADNSHYVNGELVFGEGCVDDGEDCDVIWHELGHGLHDWMTNGNLSQTNGLSEGCGDYWAQSNSRALNHWPSTRPEYHWMFNWDGHNACWGGRITNYTALYPGGLVGQIHTDGQIWATTLMRIWDRIGRQKLDKAFLLGLALTSSSTNQQNAAIAVRQAAINMNYPCADIKAMTEEFTATGYVMPAIPLTINCPANQTVTANASQQYTLADFRSLANAINTNCDAVVTQSPIPGTVLGVGVHTITVTATSGTSVNCNFTVTVNQNLGIEDFVKNDILIYPNPANNIITIKMENYANEKVSFVNMLGQNVKTVQLKDIETLIDLSDLASGVYTIKFENSKTFRKIVKN